MLLGLMDHWVPSHDAISRFWKTPFAELRPGLEVLCDELDINNFTFYTKWYSNGLKSELPFLANHPQAQNVLTDNAWGNELIEFFHQRGMTVGAMIQCYTFDAGRLPSEGVADSWQNLRHCTGDTRDAEIADPTWNGYPAVLEQMLDEQLRLFPGLDAIFLEFEGVRFKPEHPLMRQVLSAGDPLQLVAPEIHALWDESDFRPDPTAAEISLWTGPAQAALSATLRRHLDAAERVFARRHYTGIRGLVYHALGYEIPYAATSLPTAAWWLLPWHYWGWAFSRSTPDGQVRRQLDFVKRRMTADTRAGHPLCYIGNVTLPTERFDTITEMLRFSQNLGAAGYLGMGNPMPHYGLRWHDATENSVAQARTLYHHLLPRPPEK